jgi:hypothetical protein
VALLESTSSGSVPEPQIPNPKPQVGVSPAMLSAVRIGLWSSAVVAVGYLFKLIVIPNVEGVTLTIALSGATLGFRAGIAVGIIGEALFSLFNPWGPPGFFLLLAQVVSMATVGGLAGALSGVLSSSKLPTRLLWGSFGLVMSLWFDLLTTASFPLLAGMEGVPMATIMIAQIPFTLIKMTVNAVLFTIAFVPLRNRLKMVLASSILRGNNREQ